MPNPVPPPARAWPIALAGLWLATTATFALTGPGRIDIIDGVVRYLVAESWYDRGDSEITLASPTAVAAWDADEKAIFNVFPGRDGKLYTAYRLPQSILGVAAIWAADRLGPPDTGRRHLLFALTSALAGGIVAVGLADWFRQSGLPPRTAVGWAVAGVLCTPVWYYATSSFDDILGTAGVAAGYALARRAGAGRGWAWAAAAGLAGAWVVNCKPPLALLAVGMFPATDDPGRRPWHRAGVAGLMSAGFAAGVAAYKLYELFKFPPGTDWLPEFARRYGEMWTLNPFVGLVSFLFSPGAAAWLYCPPCLIGLAGLAGPGGSRRTRWAIAAGVAAYVLVICHLSFFKGPPGWGPRYLTPAFAAVWLYAPAGAGRLPARLVAILLAAGVGVQGLALAVDPWRLNLEQKLPALHFNYYRWTYFHAEYADLVQRPGQIGRALTTDQPLYSPNETVADSFPSMYFYEVPGYLGRYYLVGGFRPWPVAYRHLPADRRPVPYWPAVGGLLAAVVVGAGVTATATRPTTRRTPTPR